MVMQTNVEVKIEADDLTPVTKALSDGSREETPRLTYKHKWTIQERLTLAMLAESYSNNWDEKSAVFNHFHKSDLRRVGGLRKAVIVAQFYEMRKWFNAADALKELQTSLSPYDRSKLVSRDELEKKALDIGVQLRLQETTNPSNQTVQITISDPHDAQGRKKRKRIDEIDEPLRALTSPRTPIKIGQKKNGLLTPPDSRERKIRGLTTDKKLAQIGFRAFTLESQGIYTSDLGIRAGAFINCSVIPLARSLEASKYRDEALHHITKHDHSRPSMFVSATKNPMRALHMLLHAPQGERTLILVDLGVADEEGNVQKAHHLKLKTPFKYTGAGEYLLFGGVEPKAIIAQVPLARLLASMPTTPESDDPFCFKLLQSNKKLSNARLTIRKQVLPMTYMLGKAVGEMVGTLGIPPKLFETGVWSFVQDYKFYNAEGRTKRGHWLENGAFRNGAVQGYQATKTSDSDTQGYQAPLQHFDDFLAELRDMASILDYNDPETHDDMDDTEISERNRRHTAAKSPSHSPNIYTGTAIDDALALPKLPSRDHSEEFENVNNLCADVMRMHGNGGTDSGLAADKSKIVYEFGWTGM